LLPQSSAATTSPTHVHHPKFGHADFERDQRAYGIVEPDEKVGQVGVKAFDPHSRAANATSRLDGIRLDGRGQTSTCVLFMSASQFVRVHHSFKTVDSTLTLESADRLVELAVNQPVQSRHWGPVTQVGFVLDHDGGTVLAPHDDRASTRQRTSHESFEDEKFFGRSFVKGQRQNSRVRTKRDKNFVTEPCAARWFETGSASTVVADSGATTGWSPGSPVLWDT
jgi:hypothetical protein